MPTTQISLSSAGLSSDKQIDPTSSLGKWLVTVQNSSLMRKADTTSGNYAESVPSASQNQGQEIMYVKTSVDVNTFTLNGAVGGAIVLNAATPAAGSSVTVKSDGVNWLVKAKV